MVGRLIAVTRRLGKGEIGSSHCLMAVGTFDLGSGAGPGSGDESGRMAYDGLTSVLRQRLLLLTYTQSV